MAHPSSHRTRTYRSVCGSSSVYVEATEQQITVYIESNKWYNKL